MRQKRNQQKRLTSSRVKNTRKERKGKPTKRRTEQLKKMLEDTKQKVADHDSGHRKLEEEEYQTMTKRIGLYEKKLEKMDQPLDERVS